jgi:hypothetical protein
MDPHQVAPVVSMDDFSFHDGAQDGFEKREKASSADGLEAVILSLSLKVNNHVPDRPAMAQVSAEPAEAAISRLTGDSLSEGVPIVAMSDKLKGRLLFSLSELEIGVKYKHERSGAEIYAAVPGWISIQGTMFPSTK